MKDASWQRNFLRNTLSNYLCIIVRIGSGLVLFRLLFQHLSQEQFGYYALLWSLFGYAVLLDFGLGLSVQKTVARCMASGDTTTLNRLVATIVWSFAGIAAVLLGVFALGTGFFLDRIHVAAGNRAEFAQAYLVFFAMLALNFPCGLFPEILRGLQRLDIANWTLISGTVVNLAAMTWALFTHQSFTTIVFISTATTMLPNLLAAFCGFRRLPGLSLHPRFFCFAEVRGVLSFSLVAYLITFTTLIMQRADQAIIGVTIGVSLVALYQVGFKASEIFGMFARQLQEAISPAAAHLGATNDRAGLTHLLFSTWRLTFLVTTPLYALCAAYLEPIIRILSGLQTVDTATFWVGQVLLLSTYSSLAVGSCARRILVMCNWEKALLRLSLAEAGINLVLSFALAWSMGLVGIALGTLVPTVLIGWFGVVPLTARFLELRWSALCAEVVLPVWQPVAASLAVLALLLVFAPMPLHAGLVECTWRGALVSLAGLAALAPQWRALRARRHVPSPLEAEAALHPIA